MANDLANHFREIDARIPVLDGPQGMGVLAVESSGKLIFKASPCDTFSEVGANEVAGWELDDHFDESARELLYSLHGV